MARDGMNCLTSQADCFKVAHYYHGPIFQNQQVCR